MPPHVPPGTPASMPGPGAAGGPARRMLLPWAAVFGISLALVLAVVRPSPAGPAAADAASSVLYWERITAGLQLEAFVNTTPKPLLTVAYGLAHAITGDWLGVSLLAVISLAAAATLGSALAFRIAGPAAAIVAWVALVLDARMLVEVAWAYGLPAAMALVFGAGLALTARTPRYGLAGALLLLGALVRLEVFAVLGAATMVLGYLALRRRLPPRALLILVGWMAIPVMLLHDQVLAGDPLYWLRVSAVNAEGLRPQSVRVVLGRLVDILVSNPAVTILAVVGILGALRSNAGRIVAVGIIGLGAGTAAEVVAVGLQHRVVLGHYYSPIWVAMTFAATLGIGFAAQAAARTLGGRLAHGRGAGGDAATGATAGAAAASRLGRPARSAVVAAAVLLGLLVIRPLLASTGTIRTIDDQRAIAAQAEEAAGRIAGLSFRSDPFPPPVGALERASTASYRILVPRVVNYRMAVDLALPVTVVGPVVPDRAAPGLFHREQIVYHDQLADTRDLVPAAFEGPSPAVVDGITFNLVRADPAGTWLWQAP